LGELGFWTTLTTNKTMLRFKNSKIITIVNLIVEGCMVLIKSVLSARLFAPGTFDVPCVPRRKDINENALIRN
jgi:hypothetical protein